MVFRGRELNMDFLDKLKDLQQLTKKCSLCPLKDYECHSFCDKIDDVIYSLKTIEGGN